MIASHLAHLARLGRRSSTIYQRSQVLSRLTRFIAPTPILDVVVEQLRDFTSRPGIGLAARHAEVTHLRGFYRWAQEEGHRTDDPTVRLERPTVPQRFPRPMTDPWVRYVLTNAPERLSPWFHLAAYAGLRACEIGPLRREDVSPSSILVRDQKGGGEGVVPIPAPLQPILAILPVDGWLFPHRGPGHPGPTSAAQVSTLANRWLRAEQIPHTLHSLRHWYGTNAYRAGRDLRMAQRLLRHRSIQTTLLYTAVDDDEAAATVALLPDLTLRAA